MQHPILWLLCSRDLELIRAAGIEGLEPAFELLESALREVQHDDQKEL